MAELAVAIEFKPVLTYFIPVRLTPTAEGRLLAYPVPTSGSGDLAALLLADGLLELAPKRTQFAAGSAWPLWRYRS